MQFIMIIMNLFSVIPVFRKLLRLFFLIIACSFISQLSYSQDESFRNDIRALLSTLLENGYSVNIAEQSNNVYKGQLTAQKGKFDYYLGVNVGGLMSNYTLSPDEANIYGIDKLITKENSYGFSLQKQFDFGLTFEPRINYKRTDYEISGIVPFNQANVDFVFNMPLLRGLGKNIDAAELDNALSNYQASLDNYHHTISTEFYNCITAYIHYLAAAEVYDSFKKRLARADSLLVNTRLMVEKDAVPASEITIIEAYRGDTKLKLLSASIEINNLKTDIAKILGVDISGYSKLNLKSRELPPVAFLFKPDTTFINKSLILAYHNRMDLQALDKIQRGSNTVLDALKKNRLPELNLELGVGYSGYKNGTAFNDYYSPFYNNVGGANIQATLYYKIPFSNAMAIGNYISQKARLEQINLQKVQLEKSTGIEIAAIINNLKYLSAEYQDAYNSVNLYHKVLDGQAFKLKTGQSTFVEYYTIEDKLTEVVIQKVTIESKLLEQILKYKVVTGTLIQKSEDDFTVSVDMMFNMTD